MENIRLLKVTGAGNDFLILDQRDPGQNRLDPASRAEWARKVCHRTQGVGADGFLVLEPSSSKEVDFRWDFYNADGSNAEMCGNAARCVILVTAKAAKVPVKFETRAGMIEGQILEPLAEERRPSSDSVEVLMPKIKDVQFEQTEAVLGTQLQFDFVNSGVPHAVVGLPAGRKIEEYRATARALRSHPRFSPAGTNVTFYQLTANGSAAVQTFERGVEDFTLACGTGAVAAAEVLFHHHPQFKDVKIKMPGGDLRVIRGVRPLLIGPARVIAKIDWLG